MKIENKPLVASRRGRSNGEWAEFVTIVPKLKIGQSVLLKQTASNYRMAAALAEAWLGIRLTIVKEGKYYRAGRIR
jgi:hypothetical protein